MRDYNRLSDPTPLTPEPPFACRDPAMTSPRPPYPGERFRRQLADLLNTWVEQGLIEPAQRDRLREYYQLESLQRSAGGRFALVLLLFGAVLVGLGVISFVAANWAAIPRWARAWGCLALMVGLQVAGFQVWQQGSRRLGSALLIAGELTLGACIGLMAQWVQLGGSAAGLFWAWGMGSLAMAYSLRHSPSGVLACVLLGSGMVADFWDWGPVNFLYLYPWLALGLLVSLAYWCCSRWVFALAVVNFGLALQGLANRLGSSFPSLTLWHLLGVAVVWGLALWHQRHDPWIRQVSTEGRDQELPGELEQGLDLAPTAQNLALLGLGVLLYVWSFWGTWLVDLPADPLLDAGDPWAGLSAAGLLLLAGWGWWQGWQEKGSQPIGVWLEDATVLVSLLGLGLLVGVSSLLSPNSTDGLAFGFFAHWIVTLLLLGLSAVLCWEGLQQGRRGRFWQGLLGLTLVVLTRFFEYPTGLLVKSVALVACGIGVIWLGLKFERRIFSRL
ncbi:DUF2157 domain-containing protein [Thermostichus sp. MS-CIW-37]